MSNKQLAVELVDEALRMTPKIGEPTRWRGGDLFRRLLPCQYEVLKELVAHALDLRDECREAAIKALTGTWVQDHDLPKQLVNERLEQLKLFEVGNDAFYQLDRRAAEDWFDAIKSKEALQELADQAQELDMGY